MLFTLIIIIMITITPFTALTAHTTPIE